MKFIVLAGLCISLASAQYPPNPPPGAWGGGNRPSGYPKQPQPPGRPSPFSALSSVLPGGGAGSSGVNAPPSYDDPIPQIPHDSTYDTQSLPAKLPILAPNGVVEIYNRVVDDLIKRLETDFSKKKMDPMPVIIRPTPAGPVRVPGYLQRRPFRRPGAALYRTGAETIPPHYSTALKRKKGRSNPLPETRFPEGGRPSVTGVTEEKVSQRGSGKISKAPVSSEEVVPETTPFTAESVEESNNSTEPAGSSEEDGPFIRSRSEEFFPEDEAADEEESKSSKATPAKASSKKKNSKKDETVEEDEEDEKTVQKNVEDLLERYQTKNTKSKSSTKSSSQSQSNKGKNDKVEKTSKPVIKSKESEDDDDDDDDMEIRDDLDDDVSFDAEPGTGGGGRPQGGYYPPGGPPAVPSKPNALMTGLSKIRRASDVAVSVDARSAMVTARLLVGPLHIYVNESSEPKERGLKATIPELEAEIILMERHGVVFLQRFTLDRAYGQDVEISIPKMKGSNKKTKGNKNNYGRPGGPGGPGGPPGGPSYDPSNPNSPAAEDRYRTKMAAHMSMEVVKLLRSGNLRVNLMRTAQGSMSKLKLPIMKPKTKKPKKERKQEVAEEHSSE